MRYREVICFILCMLLCGCKVLRNSFWHERGIIRKSEKIHVSPDLIKMKGYPLTQYKNIDLSRNVYKVDSITLDTTDYTVIKSPITKHAFLISKKIWADGHFSEKAILSDPSCFLLSYTMSDMTYDINFYWMEPLDFSLEGDSYMLNQHLKPDSISYVKDSYRSYHYDIPPSYYYLILIRGDVYNQMTHSWIDGIRFSWLDFPDMNGCYKVLVPIWNDKSVFKETKDNQ